MNILAIDTATEACSVALLLDNSIQEVFEIASRQHTERVLPMVDSLLKEADISLTQLDAISFNCGPGSFTGVRVGTSVTQGLAFSADLPVIPVSSLAALAQSAYREEKQTKVLSTIDARMNEVYWGCYQEESGLMRLVSSEKVSNVGLIKGEGLWHCRGSGWDTYHTELQNLATVNINSFSESCFPHAQDVAILGLDLFNKGLSLDAECALPTYIRDEVSWKKINQQ